MLLGDRPGPFAPDEGDERMLFQLLLLLRYRLELYVYT